MNNKIKKILVTGNLGYIGTVLTEILRDKGYEVIGLDIGYYQEISLTKINNPPKQIIRDIREVKNSDINNIDAIIHLAAISNDPLGELSPGVTESINYEATVNLAKIAKKNKVKRFVYASSQSLYGISNANEPLEEESSTKNPITAYAVSKWKAEIELRKLSSNDFNVVIFRPSTVFGSSPRMRCDIVYNNFIANAYTSNKILIRSNGKPYRPAIHVNDVCSAFIAGIEAPRELINNQVFNVGVLDGNYSVLNLANYAKKVVKNSKIEILNETGHDERTYIVSFDKILNTLKNFYKPSWNLETGGKEIIKFFKSINLTNNQLNGWETNRLIQIKRLQKLNLIDKELRRL